MVDWQSIVISGLVAFGVSFLVVYARHILIDKRHYERAERRKTIIDRLEKLYTPLFTLIETIQAIHPNLITYEDIFKFEIDKPHRATFDKAIEQYNYLASDTLAPLLYKIHKSNVEELTLDEAAEIGNLIENEYKDLRDEYYEI